MLNIKKEDFEQIEVLADEEFDLKHSILQANAALSRYSNENQFNHCEFNEDTWTLHELMLKFNLNRNKGQHTKDIFDEKEFKEKFILRP